MKRRDFLGTAMGTLAALPALRPGMQNPERAAKGILIPSYLQPGDLIGITSPAGSITCDEIQPAVRQIESWGFRTVAGNSIGKKDFTFGGTDAERQADFQSMLDNPSIQAILCARGGYGAVRIIDGLDFRRYASKPKWIIGFSDITVMHSHINRNYKVATLHSKMCNSFPEVWESAEPVQVDSILSIRKALSGEIMSYSCLPDSNNRTGLAEGALVGGNLSTLESLIGTRSDLDTNHKILFVEDTGEYLYSIDRLFWSLKRSGKLTNLKALIVGGFKIKPDDPGEEFGKTIYDIVLEKVREYNYPVCFNFPVGHQKDNYALKCGILHRLEVRSDASQLVELTG
jgi:muramoyltetrapeptide carboxypeptidase